MKTIPAFYFDSAQLHNLALQYHEPFVSAEPFCHVVIDNFLPEPIANLLVDEFPKPTDIPWTVWGPGETSHTGDPNVEKLGNSDETRFGSFTRHFMSQLNSGVFLKFFESLTGTTSIIPDPTFNHCGQHSTGRGGRLMVHTDANRHPIKNKFHQHYNLIYFLNQDWKEEYGGHLELWSRDAKRCVKRILPVFNRIVLFDTGKYSYHGHPEPLTCPAGRRRNSLAVYYYVPDRPNDENYKGIQPITWVPTRKEDLEFIKKPGSRIKKVLLKILPPCLVDIYNLAKRKISRSKEI